MVINGDIMNKMIIDIDYYSDNTRISNSAIGWFLNKGPQYLRDMLDNKEEGLSGKFLERGTYSQRNSGKTMKYLILIHLRRLSRRPSANAMLIYCLQNH